MEQTDRRTAALVSVIERARAWKTYVEAPYRRPVKAVAEVDRVVMVFLYQNARSAAEGLGLTDEEFRAILNMPWQAAC